MAKLKTFAVEVEITLKRTYFVEARRPNGAAEKLLDRDQWMSHTAAADEEYLMFESENAKIVKIEEAGF